MIEHAGNSMMQKHFSKIVRWIEPMSFIKIILLCSVFLLSGIIIFYFFTEYRDHSEKCYRFVDNFPGNSLVTPALAAIEATAKNFQASEWMKVSLLNEGNKQYLNLVSLRPNWVGNFKVGYFDSLSTTINISFRFNSSSIEQDQAFGLYFIASTDRKYIGGIKFNRLKNNLMKFSIIITDLTEKTINGVNLDRIIYVEKIPLNVQSWQDLRINVTRDYASINVNSNNFQMLFDNPNFAKGHNSLLSFFVVSTEVQIEFHEVKQGLLPVAIESILEESIFYTDFNQLTKYYRNEDLIFSPPYSSYIYKMPIGNDYRNAIVGYTPFTVEYPIRRISNVSSLSTGFGILDQSWRNNIPVNFKIQLISNDKTITILDETIKPGKSIKENSWNDRVLEINANSYRESKIRFRAETPAGKTKPVFVGWANPLLTSKEYQKEKMNVLLISLDMVRSDRLSCLGNARETTPHIDELAQEGALFLQCISQASWTTPSHFSILTSQYPSVHGVIQRMAERYKKLDPRKVTLAEVLRQQGYRTAAFVANTPVVFGTLGFYQGFDQYRHNGALGAVHDIEETSKNTVEWLEKYSSNGPFFLFLHIFETHLPFTNTFYTGDSIDYQNEIQYKTHLSELYDGDLHFTDEHLVKVFNCLRRLEILDNTLVIITSDHGYVMPGEHGNYEKNGNSLYEGNVRVPLIMRFPKSIPRNKKITRQVRSIDIAPTILDLLGCEKFTEFQGVSLVPLLHDKSMDPIIAYAEALNEGPERKMVRTELFKYIYIPEMVPEQVSELTSRGVAVEQRELFNLQEDPWEHTNLTDEKPEIVSNYQHSVDNFILAGQRDTTGSGKVIQLDAESIKKLRGMGYIK